MGRAVTRCAWLGLLGCGPKGTTTPDMAEVGDADADTDADSDVDTDADADADTAVPTGLSYAADVEPIVSSDCSPCHYPGGISGGLTIRYDDIVGVIETTSGLAYVEPGSPDDSYLWHKLQGTQASVGGLGGRMPPAPRPALPAADLVVVEQWILEGAIP